MIVGDASDWSALAAWSGPPRRILFGRSDAYEGFIRRALDPSRFRPDFEPLDAVDLLAYDAVIPLDFSHQEQLRPSWGRRGASFLAPDPQVVDLCDDKQRLNATLRRAGFEAMLPLQYAAPPAFPYVLKPRRGAWGEGVRVIRSEADAASVDPLSPDHCIEQYLPGSVEYAFHVLMADGVCRYGMRSTYHMRAEHLVRSAGELPQRRAFQRFDGCPTPFLRVLRHLGYEGAACINYKMVGDTPKIMEINPRFGGSLTTDITAYVAAYVEALRATS